MKRISTTFLALITIGFIGALWAEPVGKSFTLAGHIAASTALAFVGGVIALVVYFESK